MTMPWVDQHRLDVQSAVTGRPFEDASSREAWGRFLIGEYKGRALHDKAASRVARRVAMPEAQRGRLWLRLSGGELLMRQHPKMFEEALAGMEGITLAEGVAAAERTPARHDPADQPSFGSPTKARRLCLTPEGLDRATRVLHCLRYEHSEALYCPFLPTMVMACMHWMGERETFATATALLRQPTPFVETRLQTWLRLEAMHCLALANNPKAYRELCDYMQVPFPPPLDSHHPLAGAAMLWVSHHVPFWALMRFLDNFVVEGDKTFFRFGLALLQCWSKACPHADPTTPAPPKPLRVPIYGISSREEHGGDGSLAALVSQPTTAGAGRTGGATLGAGLSANAGGGSGVASSLPVSLKMVGRRGSAPTTSPVQSPPKSGNGVLAALRSVASTALSRARTSSGGAQSQETSSAGASPGNGLIAAGTSPSSLPPDYVTSAAAAAAIAAMPSSPRKREVTFQLGASIGEGESSHDDSASGGETTDDEDCDSSTDYFSKRPSRKRSGSLVSYVSDTSDDENGNTDDRGDTDDSLQRLAKAKEDLAEQAMSSASLMALEQMFLSQRRDDRHAQHNPPVITEESDGDSDEAEPSGPRRRTYSGGEVLMAQHHQTILELQYEEHAKEYEDKPIRSPSMALFEFKGLCTPAQIAKNVACPDKLVELAFDFNFSRDDIKRAFERGHARAMKAMSSTGYNLAVQEPVPKNRKRRGDTYASLSLSLDPVLRSPSKLLTPTALRIIWRDVPIRYHLKDLVRIFDTASHGYSLKSFYSRCGSTAPTVLAVRTMAGDIFGAFLTYGWDYRLDEDGRGYFGNGESFVFRCGDPASGGVNGTVACEVFRWVGLGEDDEPDQEADVKGGTSVGSESVSSAQDSSKDENRGPPSLFMHGSSHRICVGGGRRGHAIELDGALRVGRSRPSDTYASPTLTSRSPKGDFEVASVEVFGFVEHH